MLIHTLRVGMLNTNCYIVEDETSKKALIIDPGDNQGKILEALNENRLKAEKIVITHGHFDHVGANRALKKAAGALILMHKKDVPLLKETDSPAPDVFLKENDLIKIGNIVFSVIPTPGHTPGGISLYCEKEKVLFSGDTLFYGAWGRTDLPFSSEKDMIASLKKLLKLPSETKVYPGHGRTTTIGAEQGLLAEI